MYFSGKGLSAMNKKELEEMETQFDTGDVTWEIEETKRADTIKVVLKTETRFNLLKTYLALKMICEKIERELGILDEAEGEH